MKNGCNVYQRHKLVCYLSRDALEENGRTEGKKTETIFKKRDPGATFTIDSFTERRDTCAFRSIMYRYITLTTDALKIR